MQKWPETLSNAEIVNEYRKRTADIAALKRQFAADEAAQFHRDVITDLWLHEINELRRVAKARGLEL